MRTTSEAPHTSAISPLVRGIETETLLILSKISEQKEFLENIMHRLIVISRCAEENFSNILNEAPIIYSDKSGLFSLMAHIWI